MDDYLSGHSWLDASHRYPPQSRLVLDRISKLDLTLRRLMPAVGRHYRRRTSVSPSSPRLHSQQCWSIGQSATHGPDRRYIRSRKVTERVPSAEPRVDIDDIWGPSASSLKVDVDQSTGLRSSRVRQVPE